MENKKGRQESWTPVEGCSWESKKVWVDVAKMEIRVDGELIHECYEVMAAKQRGKELESYRTRDLVKAKLKFEEMVSKYKEEK